MQSVVSKGKDINEAIHLGLSLLEASKKEVDIEIIQYEKKSFLGIGSREAIVKLTKHKAVSTNHEKEHTTVDSFELAEQFIDDIREEEIQQEEMNLLADYIKYSKSPFDTDSDLLSGKVGMKDGRLFCKSSPTHFPMVTLTKGIKLFKNNEIVTEETTIVSEKNFYEIKVENEETETKWKVTMDEHKLKVFLHVEPGYKLTRTLKDIEPDYHIELLIEEKKEVSNSLNYADVMQKLEELRVKHGFNQDEIEKALKVSEPSTFEIVTGISPIQGKDGWVELMVDLGTHEGPKEKEDGRVDFREIKHIPTVPRGKVIGIIHPPTAGKIGYTITNDPLPAKQTFPIIIKVGKGVKVVDDEKIVVTESGRPKIEQRGQLVKISIMPKLIHSGDVDLSSGNIRFVGDVEIMGEVGENMTVEAEGDITVQKTVNMATLTTSGAIVTFGNIIGSEISAGKNNMLVVELGHLLGILHQHTENIIGVIKQLTLSPAFKSTDFSQGGLQPLIRILLEKKFKNFPPLVKNYVAIVRRGEAYLDDESWKEVAVALTQLFLSLTKDVIKLERITQLSTKMKDLHNMSQTPIEPDSYITVPNVLNSRIYCSGNILVMGQGCINSKIHAGGTLKISGILRGGEVYGRLGVQINEVGAESGTATIISVPTDQKISIKKAMEGTSIKIGNVNYTFKETKYHVEARLDHNHRIAFE
jgi:uncharacterized protein (DUF342 family)